MLRLALLAVLLLAAVITASCGGSSGTFIAPDPVLYAAQGRAGVAGNLYSVDPTTGAVTPIGPIGFPVSALAVAGDGTLWGVTSAEVSGFEGNLLQIDRTTGAGSVVAPLVDAMMTPYRSIAGLSFRAGVLYGWVSNGSKSAGNNNELVTINTTTGAVSAIGSNDFTSNSWEGNGLAFSPTDVLYASSYDGDNMLLILDRSTGFATKVANFTQNSTTNDSVRAFTFIGATLYAVEMDRSGGASLVTINLATAVTTPIGLLPDVVALAYAP